MKNRKKKEKELVDDIVAEVTAKVVAKIETKILAMVNGNSTYPPSMSEEEHTQWDNHTSTSKWKF